MCIQSLCITIALLLQLLKVVSSQPDLCENPKIDSIAFIEDQKQYFFTSGGFYWLIKESELPPPKDKAKPLPNGFKRGDAAFYKNTLKACKDAKTSGPKNEETEIYLVEMGDDGKNRIMIFDLRDYTWKKPVVYSTDRTIGVAQVDWTKQIDSIFVYKLTQIYVIQGQHYAGVDYTVLCDKPDEYANTFSRRPKTDFNTVDEIDGTTMIDSDHLLMFQNNQVFKLKINSVKDGKIVTQKDSGLSVAKEFFKFGDDCVAPTGGPVTAPVVPSEGGAPGPGPIETPKEPESGAETEKSDEEKGGGMWLIIVIIVGVIVVISIALIAVMAMRQKKEDPEAGKEGEDADGAKSSKVSPSQMGSGSKASPSQISVRGAGRSQTGSKMAAGSSLGGTSPSRMSVRSKMSAVPSGAGGKSSAVKSAVSKK